MPIGMRFVMGFAGELATISLPEVFRNVAFSHLTGVLRVHGGGQDVAIYFEHGAIRAFSGGDAVVFDYEALAARDTLLDTSDDSFRDAVTEAVREEIVALFGPSEASFVFEEGRPPARLFDAEQIGCGLTIDPDTLADEASRRHDEWHSISARIGSEEARPLRSGRRSSWGSGILRARSVWRRRKPSSDCSEGCGGWGRRSAP